MMNEAYTEWLVSRKTPAYALLVKVGMILLVAVSLVVAITGLAGPFGILLVVAAVALTYFSFAGLHVEYEYMFVSGLLTIDKIVSRSRRKTVAEYSMEDVALIAPVDSSAVKDYSRQVKKTVDYSSGTQGGDRCVLIYQKGGEYTKVILEPNDKLIQCFKMTIPRKVVEL